MGQPSGVVRHREPGRTAGRPFSDQPPRRICSPGESRTTIPSAFAPGLSTTEHHDRMCRGNWIDPDAAFSSHLYGLSSSSAFALIYSDTLQMVDPLASNY